MTGIGGCLSPNRRDFEEERFALGKTPKSTLRQDWSERLQFEGRLSRLELEQEMTPLVDEAATEEIGVIRMNTAKTHAQRIIRPFALSF